MATNEKYDKSKPLRDKILYVLSVMEKASPHEVAGEIMELDEISTEDGVEDISIDIENELNELHEEGVVSRLKEHKEKRRFILNQKNIDQLKSGIMENNENATRQFQQFAESKLNNHIAELNTRYENERLGSEEVKRRAYRDHREILEQELDDKINSFFSHEKNEWLRGELQNLKHEYLDKLSINND